MISSIKMVRIFTIHIQHSNNFLIPYYRHNNFRPGQAAAGNMPRKHFYIWYNQCFCFSPTFAANTFSFFDPGARNRSLEGPQNKFIILNDIKSRPKPSELLLESRYGVGKVCN